MATDAFGNIIQDTTTGAGLGSAVPGIGTLAGAAGGLALGLGTSLYGAYQQRQAQKMMATNQRPQYQIPPEVQANLSDAQRLSLEGLPDEQKEQYINNIQRSQSFGLNSLNSRRAGLAGLGSIVESGNEGDQNLLSSDAQARQRNIQNLMAARSDVAGYKNAAYETNQLNPFLRNDNYAKGQLGAGIQNVFGGLNTAAHASSFLGGLGGGGNQGQQVFSASQPSSYNPSSPVGAVGGYSTGLSQNGAGYGLGFDPNANYE